MRIRCPISLQQGYQAGFRLSGDRGACEYRDVDGIVRVPLNWIAERIVQDWALPAGYP